MVIINLILDELNIPLPAKKVTSITFGDLDYTQMFITTAGGNNPSSEGAGAGAIFQLDSSIQGMPEFFSQVS